MDTPNEDEGVAPDEYSLTANGDADLLDDAGVAGDEVSSSAAAIVNEAASLSALSYTQTRTADTDTGASISDLLDDDTILANMEEELSSGTVAANENKPSISMVTAIVDEILRQKESIGEGDDIDIADIASKEVDRLYKDKTIDGIVEEIPRPRRSHPWNEEEGQMSSLFARERENRNTAAMISSTIKSVMGITGDAVTEDDPTAASFDRSTITGEEFDPRLPPDYDDLCSEMGLDPTESSYLGLSPPRRNRLRYFHPEVLARSPKCQFCVIVVCLVGIATAISLSVTQGIERQKKRDQELHPHWMEEQNANGDKDWWKEGDQFGGDNAENKGESFNTPLSKFGDRHKPLAHDELEQLYYTVSDAYLPIWYDRETGWKGQNFKEAMEFCRAHDDFVPCPYEVYCPGRAGNLIFGERFEDEEESWAPILDDWNEWVQVGNGRKQCVTFSGTYRVKPSWGMTGSLTYVGSRDVEKATQHIMCCLEQPLGNDELFVTPEVPIPYVTTEHGQGEADHIPPHTNDLPDLTGPSDMSLPKIPQLTTNDQEVHKNYDPFWFTEAAGWKGTTYEDGRTFCESMMYGSDINDHFRLCPMLVHCPNGNEVDKPLVYQMEAFDEGMQWSPISNGFNQWVMVGRSSDGPFTCRTHLELNHHEPDWGIDGTQPELKKYILCCQGSNKADSGIQKHLVDESLVGGNGAASHSPTQEIPAIQIRPTDPMDEVLYPLTSSEQSIQTKPTDDATNLPSLSKQGMPSALSGAEEEDDTIPPHTNDLPDITGPSDMSFPEPPELTTNDQEVRKNYDPFWFTEDDGWKGTTYEDGRTFCESMMYGPDVNDHFRLCPFSAYCPNGKEVDKPLVYQMEALDEGMQWSPISNGFNQWVMVGRSSDGPFTCRTHLELNYHEPDWGIDGTQPELKKYILCCQGNEEADGGIDMDEIDESLAGGNGAGVPHTGAGNSSPHPGEHHTDESITALKRAFDPVWFDFVLGWNGGTHDEALEFCDSLDRELCPYGAYCPQGPTYPALPGHGLFNSLGEKSDQWAPIINANNEWVMIGTVDNNKSTQCMDYSMLNGGDSPSWGLDGSMGETKLHILCCDKSTFVSAAELEQEREQYLGSDAEESEPQSTTFQTSEKTVPEEQYLGSDPDSQKSEEMVPDTDPAMQTGTWFNTGDGWNAGSNDDGIHFCALKEMNSRPMELCPYESYCPSGPSQPPADGVSVMGDEEHEQWAPMGGGGGWVIVGMRGHNTAVQCLTHENLYGADVEVDLPKDKKHHIMCCGG